MKIYECPDCGNAIQSSKRPVDCYCGSQPQWVQYESLLDYIGDQNNRLRMKRDGL